MRTVSLSQVLVFAVLAALILILAFSTTALVVETVPSGMFRPVLLLAAFALTLCLYALLFYRILLLVIPLGEGEIPEGSREEFGYHLYLLFYLIFFHPLMRGGFLPVPLMRLVYIALGARLGANTYCSGIIFDPPFARVGDNTLIGQSALLIPHVIEGRRLAHYPIEIGSGVTIGANAVVLSGVTIGDGAIVAVGAVVPKGTRIGHGEVWGGVPARKIGSVEDPV